MPTYGYECKSCGHTFDVFQRMSDEPFKVCPECGKELRRLINGGTGVIFKGSGFYVTDRKGSQHSGAAKTQAKAPSDTGTAGAASAAAGTAAADTGGASCTACAKAESCPGNSGGGTTENKAAG